MAGDQPTPSVVTTRAQAALVVVLDLVMTLAAGAGISALAMEYGFPQGPLDDTTLHLIEGFVLVVFLWDRLLRVALTGQPSQYLRENWMDLAIVLAAGLLMLASDEWRFRILAAAVVYVIITQVYNLVAIAVKLTVARMTADDRPLPPLGLATVGLLAMIGFATGLFMLPRAMNDPRQPLNFLDALVTAVNASCVTGLSVRDLVKFSTFGQSIILMLVQVGGLTMMLLGGTFFVLIRRTVQSASAGGSLQTSAEPLSEDLLRTARFVVIFTLAAELVGAAAMFPMWMSIRPDLQPGLVAFTSVFHAVNAFCNAGFVAMPGNVAAFREHELALVVLAVLALLGGLGTPVLHELYLLVVNRVLRRPGGGLGTHTRLVLTATLILIVGGAVGLLAIQALADPGHTFGAALKSQDNAGAKILPLRELPLESRGGLYLFESAVHTTGMAAYDQERDLTEAGKQWTGLLILAGGSPGGAAGGIKTVALALLFLAGWRALRNKPLTFGGREISNQLVRQAWTLLLVYGIWLVLVTLGLSCSMSGLRLTGTQLWFEACSATASGGLSLDVTPNLNLFGKWTLAPAVFVGRLLPLWALAFMLRRQKPAEAILLV